MRQSNMIVLVFSLFLLLTFTPLMGGQESPIRPTICTFPNNALIGDNLCPSPQYRYNAELTGGPKGDGNVLNATTVANLELKFSKSVGLSQQTFNGPSSSPSVVSRIIYGAHGDDGFWHLYAFGLGGGNLSWTTTTQIYTTIHSSSGYGNGLIYVGTEDNVLYAFEYASGAEAWNFPTNDLINSSPAVWPGLDGVYVIDASSYIYKLNHSGGLMWDDPVHSAVFTGTGAVFSASASSVSVTTCGGSCTRLFVAGGTQYGGGGSGIVKSYNSADGTFYWSHEFDNNHLISSSPVLSTSENLVYVQSRVGCAFYPCDGLLYALDQASGATVWAASPAKPSPTHLPQPAGLCFFVDYYHGGGSPAYDSVKNYVVASAEVTSGDSCGHTYSNKTILAAYDATRTGDGKIVWKVDVGHQISYSSPTVVDGVVYIATDNGFADGGYIPGYILAFDEKDGTLLWTSLPNVTSGFFSPPVVSFNRVHVVDNRGHLFVYGLDGY